MRMSIRTKLFLSMSCLIVFFVIISLVVNTQFLGRYYIRKKTAALLESRAIIEKIYKGEPENISFELESLERNKGMSVYILKPDYQLRYNSTQRIFNIERRMKPADHFADRRIPLIFPIQTKLADLAVGQVIIDVIVDPRLQTKFLVLGSRLENDEILILSSPIAAINESVVIANKFLLFNGIITIILGAVAVFIFSRRFTKPILELNNLAQRMSKLDFSKKYLDNSDDEVGQLGKSINSLSDQLDEAITELQEANAKLREDIEQERRIDSMRKEFISNVSHELKTPIALIQGYAEGLKLNVHEDEENRNFYCEVIMDESDKMNKLVKGLLDLSQIESGFFELEKSIFPISALVDHVLDKYRPILVDKGIKVETRKDDQWLVNGDAVRIEQVLVNFLNNAINHVDNHKIIEINISYHAGKLRVGVYNSGSPIPEESLDKIWTSFYKVDKARTRAYGGTGLGLSVVRAILELHGSAYGVENLGQGVLFWFEMDKEDHQEGFRQ